MNEMVKSRTHQSLVTVTVPLWLLYKMNPGVFESGEESGLPTYPHDPDLEQTIGLNLGVEIWFGVLRVIPLLEFF